ncbi:MAG: ABC transporter ATP-binding protein [Chloroflexi bacterium]|nr:ABC transporter ATP-binding protein [Chloroflexota bacterium]
MLEVRDLHTAYGRTRVHRGVSITIEKGEIVAVLGPNGSGKTTLLGAIAGLLAVSDGRIIFSGDDVTGWTADRVTKAGVSLVPEGRRIFPGMTVRDNLALGAYTRSTQSDVDEDLERMLDYFPILRERLGAQGTDLSGGQQQMLAIARGLMARPTLILLDEPSLGLSPVLVQEIEGIIRGLRDEFGASVLLVEQNAGLALGVAERGYLMQTGAIAAEGSLEEMRNSGVMQELYLPKTAS